MTWDPEMTMGNVRVGSTPSAPRGGRIRIDIAQEYDLKHSSADQIAADVKVEYAHQTSMVEKLERQLDDHRQRLDQTLVLLDALGVKP